MTSRLVLRQTLRYDYPSPITNLRHLLMVLPPARHGDQRRVSSSLDIRGADAEILQSVDMFGNIAVGIHAATVQSSVEFEVQVVVGRGGGGPAPAAVAGDWLPLLDPSRLTAPDRALAAAARRLLRSGPAGLALAERINGWVAAAMRYRYGVTGVRTTAAEALAFGEGVCQDYAHVMLALCRLCRLPARYVSGHLVGEGGSHAWVEVLVPTAGDPRPLTAVAFDPTNDRRVGTRYLTVAVGRDYGDVAPTSGTYTGSGPSRLTTVKTLHEETVDLVSA